jgi:endonuclease/exonuclease/phosphatase family metal-dependent hydrolase
MIIFISAWIFSSYSVIPRWTGVEPAMGLIIILALVAGIFFRNSLLIKIGFWAILGLSGIVLMGFVSGIIGFIGGVILAFVFPSYWKIVISNLKNVPPGRTFIVSGLLILIFIFGSIFTVAFDVVPLGFLFKQREEPLLILAYLIAVFLHQELLLIKPGVRIVKPRKQFFVVLSIILVLLVPAGSIYRYSRGIDTPAGDIDHFSVMTYNIQQGFDEFGNVNFNTVANNIRLSNPWIVGLQETDTLRMSSSNRDVMEWLGNELLMHSYAGPLTKDSTFGNGMLSKFELVSKETLILTSEGGLAVLQVITVSINNQVINVLNAHFGVSEIDRTVQAQETRDLIETLNDPVILMGDFNSEPDSSQMQLLYDIGMINAMEYGGANYTATNFGGSNIDFVMYRDLTLISAEVYSDLTGSDHFPVYAVFDI